MVMWQGSTKAKIGLWKLLSGGIKYTKNKTMECTDLMIGDWIHVNPISKKVKPHDSRVLSIRREYTGQVYIEGGYKDIIPSEGEDKWFGWSVGIEDISPIPLTIEILEKIGFVRLGEQYNFWLMKGFNVPLKLVDGVFGYYEQGQPYSPTFVIKYVHELQHLFRMVGIEKEIVL